MRRKILILLAVPALFLISLVLLMSDIRHISSPHDPLSVPTGLKSEGSNRRFREPEEQTLKERANNAANAVKQQVEELEHNNQELADRGKEIAKDVQNKGQELVDQAREKGSEVLDQAKDIAQKVQDGAEDAANKAKELLNESVNRIDEDDRALPKGEPAAKKGKGGRTPPVYTDEMRKRAEAVKQGYLHAWKSYEKTSWGQDETRPMSRTTHNWLHMGLSIVDSIDTMWLMGLKEEYKKARDWIEHNLSFDSPGDISVFETTIRIVGGMVSMYDLTGDKMYINKVEALAKKLMPAFDSPTGIPYTTINLASGRAFNPSWAGDSSILSEAGTVQMEYATLSRHTGNSEYGKKALRVFDQLDSMTKPMGGLYPVYVNNRAGTFSRNHVTLGALGDSFYEYLLKVYLVTGKNENKYRRMYNEAMDAVVQHLVKYSTPSNFAYIAEWDGSHIDKMDHLVCFAGAMFALGAYHNATDKVEEHARLGAEITRTCHETYKKQASGLGPEIVRFAAGQDFIIDHGAKHYILRPETVESYYVLYWITHDPKYQEWGWEAFQAIEKHCRTENGYAGVRDVTITNSDKDDLQQSFFMAETLKYLYLLFAPLETLSLDEFVFNTEAHPIRIWK